MDQREQQTYELIAESAAELAELVAFIAAAGLELVAVVAIASGPGTAEAGLSAV
jgi:hypothetical protein